MMKKCKKIFLLMISFVLAFTVNVGAETQAQGEGRTYEIPDLDVALEIPDFLYGATRASTSADPALNLLDISLEELKMSFSMHDIYLEAFPENLSYEIVLSGTQAPEDAKDFNGLSEAEILETVTEKNKDASYHVESINGNQYLVTSLTVSDNIKEAYILKYTTVRQGKSISLTLQSQQTPTPEISRIYQDVLGSLQYREIKDSLANHPAVAELSTTLLGMAVVIGILGIVLFAFLRLEKKSKPHNP